MEETHRKPKGNEIELESNDGGDDDDTTTTTTNIDDDDTNNVGMMSAFGHVVHDVWEHIPGHHYAETILGFHHDDEDEPGTTTRMIITRKREMVNRTRYWTRSIITRKKGGLVIALLATRYPPLLCLMRR